MHDTTYYIMMSLNNYMVIITFTLESIFEASSFLDSVK